MKIKACNALNAIFVETVDTLVFVALTQHFIKSTMRCERTIGHCRTTFSSGLNCLYNNLGNFSFGWITIADSVGYVKRQSFLILGRSTET